MTLFDWLIVVLSNGAIVVYGLLISRGTTRASDWFLAARGLPWWIVGLSLFATAVDSGDYVAVVGGAYHFGLANLTAWWLGLPLGWFIVAYFVFLPLYRSGMFTNAEYLEYRFGPAVRLLSALIQIQYRTNVLGNIAFSLYLMFSIVGGLGKSAWWIVVAIAIAAAAYTALGGLKSVAITDALQSVIMFLASMVLWIVLWNSVGGWSGLEARFQAIDPSLAESMLHVGGQQEPGVPAAVILFGWVVTLTAYCVVNHSQAMRLLAARSEWDMRMAAFLASACTVVVMWFNISLGVLGRAVLPDLALVDELYPQLVRDYLSSGLLGLVVAGVLAGGISTYDSIGSAVAAVFTRDIYARFLVKSRDDRHYLRVSRWATVGVIAISFGYIPFFDAGMMVFFLRITSVAVIPLFTVTLLGTLTRVHRRSGAVGLVAGIVYGLSALIADSYALPLPIWWTHTWWAYLWNVVIPAVAMLAATAWWGWASDEEVGALVYSRRDEQPLVPLAQPVATRGTWLESSRQDLPPLHKYPFAVPPGGLAWYRRPFVWALAFLLVVGFVNLVVLW